jgi:hypothetical protein
MEVIAFFSSRKERRWLRAESEMILNVRGYELKEF